MIINLSDLDITALIKSLEQSISMLEISIKELADYKIAMRIWLTEDLKQQKFILEKLKNISNK